VPGPSALAAALAAMAVDVPAASALADALAVLAPVGVFAANQVLAWRICPRA
jgi:hypothetical protein